MILLDGHAVPLLEKFQLLDKLASIIDGICWHIRSISEHVLALRFECVSKTL